jgi:hypothetical protein
VSSDALLFWFLKSVIKGTWQLQMTLTHLLPSTV